MRAILITADGAVSIRADDHGNRNINYLSKGNTFTQTRRGRQMIWQFTLKKETLTIKIHSMRSDVTFVLDDADPGLTRAGTEHQLQAWLAGNPDALGPGIRLVEREHRTSSGPVDLLVQTADGDYIAVEVKRVAMLGSADQAARYVEALNAGGEHGTVTGMIAALDIRPKTRALAERRGIVCVELPATWNDLPHPAAPTPASATPIMQP